MKRLVIAVVVLIVLTGTPLLIGEATMEPGDAPVGWGVFAVIGFVIGLYIARAFVGTVVVLVFLVLA